MYIELIDLLRCPREHDDSWLVAAFYRMDERFVIEGKLACPLCSATYAIHDGVADLRDSAAHPKREEKTAPRPEADAALHTAALLGLTKPGATVILCGSRASLGGELSQLTESRVIALNPDEAIPESENVAVVRAQFRFPVAAASVSGIALDESSAAEWMSDASRVLVSGARLVAPASVALGPAFRELARDDRYVVAESVGQLVSLSR